MGNIKTHDIKQVAFKIIEVYPDRVSKDFEENKNLLKDLKINASKTIRNKVAGEISTIAKRKK